MRILDDEKGGKYHGSFSWPDGAPIPDNKKGEREKLKSTEVEK